MTRRKAMDNLKQPDGVELDIKQSVPVKWRCLWCDGRGTIADVHYPDIKAPAHCPNMTSAGCPPNSLVTFWTER